MSAFTIAVTRQMPFADALAAVRDELAAAGFGVITEIDLSATLREKIGVSIPGEVILGACNPGFAHQAITANPAVATLLPCNVVVRSAGENATVVEAFDPVAMTTLAGGEDAAFAGLAAEVSQRLRAALTHGDGKAER